jgi:hypothetical protein
MCFNLFICFIRLFTYFINPFLFSNEVKEKQSCLLNLFISFFGINIYIYIYYEYNKIVKLSKKIVSTQFFFTWTNYSSFNLQYIFKRKKDGIKYKEDLSKGI